MSTENNSIFLILQGQNQEEVHFKIRKETPLKKLFDKYCERNGIRNPESVAFLYENKRINGTHTANKLKMENEDIISVVVPQVGG